MKKFVILITITVFLAGIAIQANPQKKELTLKEAIQISLKNNLDLKIEILNSDYFWNSIEINKSIYIPTFDVNSSMSETKQPSSNFFSRDININERQELSLTLNQKIPLGGDLSIQMTNSRSESNSQFSTVNPYLSSQLSFSLSQPLLKGFGSFATNKDIYITLNDYKSNKQQLRKTIIDLIYNVEQNYWNLVYAYQNKDAQQKALERATDLLKQNEIKVRVGAAAPIDILSAKAEKANFESTVIQAEQQVQTAEEALKKILNIVQEDYTINPIDKPEIKKITVDFNKFLLEALNNRPDIIQAKLDLENQNIRVRYARNQMLPSLNLTASYFTVGRGGDQLILEGNPFTGNQQVVGSIKKDIWDSINETVSNLYQNYSVSLNLSLPLSLKRERAQLMQAQINLKKSLLSLKKIENTIYSDVKEALKELETREKIVDANRITLELRDQHLKAEHKKLSVGLATNFDVINAQRDYLTALSSELNSRIQYKMTIAQINQILARTFEAFNIKFKDFIKNK